MRCKNAPFPLITSRQTGQWPSRTERSLGNSIYTGRLLRDNENHKHSLVDRRTLGPESGLKAVWV